LLIKNSVIFRKPFSVDKQRGVILKKVINHSYPKCANLPHVVQDTLKHENVHNKQLRGEVFLAELLI